MTDYELFEAAKKAVENIVNESSTLQKARENLEHLQEEIRIWIEMTEQMRTGKRRKK